MIHLDARGYAEFVSGGGLRIIDMWAPWCGPCRAFAPTFEAVAGEMEGDGALFAKLDVDAAQDVAIGEEIVSIPSVVIYRDGQRVAKLVGMMAAPELRAAIADAAGA